LNSNWKSHFYSTRWE